MSKELLIELQKECSELGAAGSDLAIGNFKLQKLLPKFQMVGEKVKPFKMVYDRLNVLLNSPKEESEENLMSLATLVNAILLTQADTDIEGEIKVQGGIPNVINTSTPNRIIAPVMEALTTTGGGRHNVIDSAIKEGIFEDSRLLPLLVQGLDDKYAEIGQLIYDYLSSNNRPELLTILQEGFDKNGKKGDALKLNIISKILGEDVKELCIDLLEDSSKEVKAEAVLILGNIKGTEEILLQQAKSKLKEVRRAAYFGLVKVNSEAAKEELKGAIKKSDYDIVLEAVGDNDSLICEERLMAIQKLAPPSFAGDGDLSTQTTDEVKSPSEGDSDSSIDDILIEGFKYVYEKLIKKETESDIQKLINIINEIRYHKSEKMFKVLVKYLEDDNMTSWNRKEYGRTVFVERLVADCVAEYENIPSNVLELLESRKVRFDNRNFDIAFKASIKVRTCEEVYEMYSPYFINKSINKDMIEDILLIFSKYLGYRGIDHRRNSWYDNLSKDDVEVMMTTTCKEFDKRWITIFKMYNAYSLLSYTIEKEDEDTIKFLANKMKSFNKSNKDNRGRFQDFSLGLTEAAMGLIKIGYEEAYEVVLDKVKATTGYDYRYDNVLLLVPYLPKNYVEEVKKYVVELKEKSVYSDNAYLEMRVKNIEEALI